MMLQMNSPVNLFAGFACLALPFHAVELPHRSPAHEMEATMLRGLVSRSTLRGGSSAWSRGSVARNSCRTLSFDVPKTTVQKSKAQHHQCLFRMRLNAVSGNFFVQSCRLQGITNEMSVWIRVAGLSSFGCQHFGQRLENSQGLTFCLHIGSKVRSARPFVSLRKPVAAQFPSFCTGPVVFNLATRFHTVSVKEGRYIRRIGGQEGQGHSVDSLDEYTGKAAYSNDEIENELHHCVVSSVSADIESAVVDESRIKHWVVNFYHFVSIDDPHLEVARHTEFLKNHDVRGRIYISEQGINAQLSSRGKAGMDYAEWVKTDPRFSGLLVQTSPSPEGHAFPRLRLRYRPCLVQVDGGTEHLPVTDPTARAVPLSPAEWTERLDEAIIIGRTNNVASEEDSKVDHEHLNELEEHSSNSARQVILLDVRNGYEWDVGHFKGAQRPNVDCFKSTAFGLAEEDVSDDPLADLDKDKVDVMMYCTGGIRCDVYSTMLRAKGFKNLYSLKGGVSNYLKEEGAKKWAGNLFVFDSRLAVTPDVYHLKSTEGGGMSDDSLCEDFRTQEAFARCRMCGDPLSSPRHRNCANLDCNQLYLSCDECLPQFKGCCSYECSSAPKLRPLISKQQYERWHKYRPAEPAPPKPADYVSRRAMKRRRRKERRKQLMLVCAKEEEFEQLVQSA